VTDLNKLYTQSPALYRHEFDPHGFEWLDCNDRDHSVLSYIRKDGENYLISIFNFTPVPREAYRIGVPENASYEVIMNSDSEYYSGSNFNKQSVIQAEEFAWSDRPYSIKLDLPPLAGIVIKKATV
jgi:1,4-alpha-glucan branching enzyme